MIARPDDDAFQTLADVKDQIAAEQARRAQLEGQAERWRPLDDH